MQNQPVKNTPLDMEKWREIIEGWSLSGENQKAYCQRLGLNIHTLSHARSKLLSKNKVKAKNKFIPVTLKNISEEKRTSPASSLSTMVLENSRGYKLHLPASLSIDELSKLFQLSGWSHA
jgi:hypothetical protein